MTEHRRPPSRNRLAALAYPLGAVGAVVCLWRGRKDPFVLYHAWQSILLTVMAVVLGAALRMIPLVGPPLALTVGGALVATALFVAARAYRGHWTAVPLLGDLAFARIPPALRP